MADLILPDGRFIAPGLYYPNRLPESRYRINWSHPLTRGLTFFAGLNEVDLVSGVLPEYGANLQFKPVHGHGVLPYMPGDAADEYVQYAHADMPQLADTDRYTISFVYCCDTDSTTDASPGDANTLLDTTAGNTEGVRLFWSISGTNFRHRHFSPSGQNNDCTPNYWAANEPVIFSVTYDGDAMRTYQNGAQIDYIADSGILDPITDDWRWGQLLSGGAAASAALGALGRFMIHDRALSGREILAQHNNYYQFLLPA